MPAASHVWVRRRARNVTLAFRVAAFALAVLWWLPTITLTVADLAWREVRFRHRVACVRRLRRTGQLDDAQAALDRLRQDFVL